jgi:hypothetical protein
MKTVYGTPAEIAHLWASQNIPKGVKIKNSKNQISAEDNIIWSYGEPIGVMFGHDVYLCTYNFSNTTCRHQSEVFRATNHKNRICLPVVFHRYYSETKKEWLKIMAEQCRDQVKSLWHGLQLSQLEKARKINNEVQVRLATIRDLEDFAHGIDGKGAGQTFSTLEQLIQFVRDGKRRDAVEELSDRIDMLCQQAKFVAESLSLYNEGSINLRKLFNRTSGYKPFSPDILKGLQKELKTLEGKSKRNWKACAEKAKETYAALEIVFATRASQIMEEYAEEIKLWRANELSEDLDHEIPPLLRLSTHKTEIQTSWGANVPVEVAEPLWAMVQDCIVKKEESNQHVQVGYYRLEHISPDGDITVGCHKIAYSELQIIANQLGFKEAA